ncbi:MAG: hypothetical protein DWH81_11765 [Planctomycetota bacterium]|jgi:hypothetical protein|nr:MAG: hypothetical protein DWH81_11765 [Planctomycetota bacterium]
MFEQTGQELFNSTGREMAKNEPATCMTAFFDRPDWSLNDQLDLNAHSITGDSQISGWLNFYWGMAKSCSSDSAYRLLSVVPSLSAAPLAQNETRTLPEDNSCIQPMSNPLQSRP